MGTHPIFESDFDCLTENGFRGRRYFELLRELGFVRRRGRKEKGRRSTSAKDKRQERTRRQNQRTRRKGKERKGNARNGSRRTPSCRKRSGREIGTFRCARTDKCDRR